MKIAAVVTPSEREENTPEGGKKALARNELCKMRKTEANPRKVERSEKEQRAENSSAREWFDLTGLCERAAVCRRTLLTWIVDGLPASKVRGKWLVRRRDFDAYVERHREIPSLKIPVSGRADISHRICIEGAGDSESRSHRAKRAGHAMQSH
jgi:hypothetical protein